MQKTVKKFSFHPSIKLNTLVIIEIVMLLMVSLGALLYFTRKSLVEEMKMDAEQQLEGTLQHVDNVLLTVEQSAGNIYYRLLENIDQPERMSSFCRHMVECTPNIVGCAIALKPGYLPDNEQSFFYVHRKKYNSPELITLNNPVNYPYTKQYWYTETMKNCRPAWIDPGQNHDYGLEPVITFCLPILDLGGNGECVGVIAVGLSINLLSQIVLENKPSPNSYNLLLAHDGTYIIHPSREKLAGKTVFDDPDITESPSALEAAETIVRGGSGDQSFQMNDFTWYLFYKPFVRRNISGRSMEPLNWHIATVYPKSDIFGEYNHLVLHVMGIVFVALLVFYMLCRMAIRKQLKPLAYLTESANRIAEGHYDERIPDVRRDDEVGTFYKHFQLMQKALEEKIKKQEEQRATLLSHHEELQRIYLQIKEDDEVKNTFLHNITNRMIAPSESIFGSVSNLCDNYQTITLQEANKEISNIKEQSETIQELLSHKFYANMAKGPSVRSNAPSAEAGKEEHHE